MDRKSGHPIDPIALEKMRRIVPGLLRGERPNHLDWHAMPLPGEVAFKLTNRCDLRCAHCYQWNEDGYHHRLPSVERRDDLDLRVIERVFEATRALRSNVYLWGGEPLLYRHWEGLVDLLAGDPRWTALCTNGSLIEKRFESLKKISRRLEVSVSLDGFQSEHDSIRGKGSYERALAGIRLLVAQKQAREFHGEITVNFVLSDAMIHRASEFISFLDQENVETVYLSFPWHISTETTAKMDQYVSQHFPGNGGSSTPSWHSYTFRVEPDRIEELKMELARINAGGWRLKLRYNPKLDDSDIHPFIMGSDRPAQNKTSCQSIRTRMDVFPNGDVVSCKFFPEFRVGNLHDQDVAEVWRGQRFDHVRKTIAQCGLMPVCAKCSLLYSRGA